MESVQPSAPGGGDPGSAIPRMVPASDRLTVTNMPLRLLIRIAPAVDIVVIDHVEPPTFD